MQQSKRRVESYHLELKSLNHPAVVRKAHGAYAPARHTDRGK